MFGYSQLVKMNTHLTWHKGTSKVYQMVAYLVFQGSQERLLYPLTKTGTASLDSDRSNLICSTERISNIVYHNMYMHARSQNSSWTREDIKNCLMWIEGLFLRQWWLLYTQSYIIFQPCIKLKEVSQQWWSCQHIYWKFIFFGEFSFQFSN